MKIMKVNIGKYKNYIGPFQIAEMLCFWAKNSDEDYISGKGRYPDWVHDFGLWLSGGEDRDSLLQKVCSWIECKRKRKIKVKVDRWDTWDAHSTLAYVILPVLKEFKNNYQGAPSVDDEDVPDHLKRTQFELENSYDTDPAWFDRWKYVLDEMIFAFENIVDDDWESQFHHGNIDFEFVPLNDGSGCSEMVKGPNDTSSFDKEGYKIYDDRIQNGLELFGKYYRGLWS